MFECDRGTGRFLNPIDTADDSLQAGDRPEQPTPESAKIVRRIEISVEREIITVIMRRKNEPQDRNSAAKPPECRQLTNPSST